MVEYSLYLVECADGSLYTGVTTDVDRRFREHATGQKGARYLRGRGPLTLVFHRPIGDRALAQRVEARVRKLPRRQKRDLERLPGLIERMLEDLGSGQ